MRFLDVTTSVLTTVLRLGAGRAVGAVGARPEKPLELYEFESCPFCRKAREELSRLDIDAVVYPCPKGGTRYRPWVREQVSWETAVGVSVHVPPSRKGHGETNLFAVPFKKWCCG